MHLNFSAAPKLSLLKLATPSTQPVRASTGNFAALLGSIETETPQPENEPAPTKASKPLLVKKATESTEPKEIKNAVKGEKQAGRLSLADLEQAKAAPGQAKKEELEIKSSPEEQRAVSLTLLATVANQTAEKPVALPLSLALPVTADVELSTLNAPAPDARQASSTAPKPASSGPQVVIPPSVPGAFLAGTPVPIAMPHIQVKAKSAANSDSEALSAPRMAVEDSPEQTPLSKIAFEAKLTPDPTPAQPKPSDHTVAASPSSPLPQPQSPGEEVKNSPDPQLKKESKPEGFTETSTLTPTAHAATPRNVVAAETPTIVVPAAHAEKSVVTASTKETAAPAAGQALEIPELPPLKTEPARDISFRIASTPTDAVDIKLVERAGEIHVAVRSSDPGLTQTLQANVTELAGKLERAGFQAETLIPDRANPVLQPQQNTAFQDFQNDRRAPQQEFETRKKKTVPHTATFTLNTDQEKS